MAQFNIEPRRTSIAPVEMQRINDDIIAQFRSQGGTIDEGRFKGAPILLLSTTGARSGMVRLTPLVYTRDGARYVIIASKAGAPNHPDWYHNLVANPQVMVEVGPERFTARASVTDGAERDRLFDAQASVMPVFTEYQRQTARRIPVVVLERIQG
jgi:deazaflavin-dependent oxidoreductase (nitroreductase family)